MKNRNRTFRVHACLLAPMLAGLLASPITRAAEGSPCGPGMSGSPKTIVFYTPAARIASAAELMPEHLSFLQAQMGKGVIQYAGPLVTGGAPTGRAVLVYNGAEASAVKAVVQTDPMVVGQVFNYQIDTWLECQRAPGS
ncbi:MAG: hypothetical protein ABI605_20505 [Rhizobacter sp.]